MSRPRSTVIPLRVVLEPGTLERLHEIDSAARADNGHEPLELEAFAAQLGRETYQAVEELHRGAGMYGRLEQFDGGQPIEWHLADNDRKPDDPLHFTRTGLGLYALVESLRDLIALEHEHVPPGMVPSGNVAIYWSRPR